MVLRFLAGESHFVVYLVQCTTKQDFPTTIFSGPTLLTVEYSSGYLLFNTRVWIHENQGPQFGENYIIAKKPKRDQLGASLQSLPKIKRILAMSSFACNESRHDSYPQSPRSRIGMPGTMRPLLCTKYKEKTKGYLWLTHGLSILEMKADNQLAIVYRY